MVIDRYHRLVLQFVKGNQEDDTNQRGNERYENKMAWRPHTVPTSKASEHGSELNQQAVAEVGEGDGRVQRPKHASFELGARNPEETSCHLPVDGSNSLELLPFRTLVIGRSILPLLRSHDNAFAATCSVLLFFTVHASSLS